MTVPRRELAVLGGAPCFREPLHVGRPHTGDTSALSRRIQEALDRRWLTNNGPLVQEFEERIALLLGVRNCVAVANATSGLELALETWGLSGEVIVPALTFVASASCLVRRGLRPVFCEVDPRTHQIDVEAAEALINEHTSAILGVHLWGSPCDVTALETLAERSQVRLLFDAAHAFASAHERGLIGQFGDAEVFSFHATKFVQSAEGGAVVTNDDALARELRLRRNFGFSGLDTVVRAGTNAKMSELHAAVGLTSLDALPELLDINLRNYTRYADVLGDLPGVELLAIPPVPQHNHQYVVATVNEDYPLTRDELAEVLWAENVLVRRYFTPGLHRIAALNPESKGPRTLPVTERLCGSLMQFPTGPAVSTTEIEQIAEIVRHACREAGEVRRHLQSAKQTTRRGTA